MQPHTVKQEILETVSGLPDNTDYEKILYRLYVANKVHQGIMDAEEGKGITTDEMMHEIGQW